MQISGSAIFIVQLVIGLKHYIELHPDSLVSKLSTDTPELVKERHLEFVSETFGSISLSIIGIILVWYSDDHPRNKKPCVPKDILCL